jgi:peptidyl-prolyl cis-trans isomerase B (cyclophilin B)
MAKRRKSSGRPPEIQRAIAATSPRRTPPRPPKKTPPPSTGINRTWLWIGGAAVAIAVLAVTAYALGWIPGVGGAVATPTPAPLATRGAGPFEPPTATPLASPPAEPAGDGTTVTIETSLGNIVMEIYNESAPVAATNFTNLVDAGYYNTLVFHRIMPGFVIQGGDPNGNGSGGPGYNIPDEPVVGDYARGTLAMARTSAPDSAGSQFFIVLDDAASASLDGGGYVIFGKVTTGMEIADQIAAGPSTGGQESQALDPVVMERVTVQRP